MYIVKVDTATEAVGVGIISTGNLLSGEALTGDGVLDVGLDPSELYFPEA